jgi:hypothetical protein
VKVGNINPTTLIVGAVALAVGYILLRGVKGVVGDVVTVIDEAAGAAIMKVSTVFGIPETDVKKCGEFLAAGDTWNALFYCPAGTFYRAMTGEVIDPATGEVIGKTPPGDESIVKVVTQLDDTNPDDVYLLN